MTSKTDDEDTFVVVLREMNTHITCPLCSGYFIDATTILDCLHTFCKSCLLTHFANDNNTCPKCELLIHQSHPSHYVSQDRTMQDLVYKLVPDVHREELRLRSEFRKAHASPSDDDHATDCKPDVANAGDKHPECHRTDEQISVALGAEGVIVQLKRPFIKCSAFTTVTHLKKLIAMWVYNDQQSYNKIDIMCNDELMGKDHTLKFIAKTRWRTKVLPLALTYRKHVEF